MALEFVGEPACHAVYDRLIVRHQIWGSASTDDPLHRHRTFIAHLLSDDDILAHSPIAGRLTREQLTAIEAAELPLAEVRGALVAGDPVDCSDRFYRACQLGRVYSAICGADDTALVRPDLRDLLHLARLNLYPMLAVIRSISVRRIFRGMRLGAFGAVATIAQLCRSGDLVVGVRPRRTAAHTARMMLPFLNWFSPDILGAEVPTPNTLRVIV